MKDEYADALRMLREEATEPSDGGEGTRLRVLGTLQARKSTSRRGGQVWFAIAACLATSLAFAHYISSARDSGATSVSRTQPTVRVARATSIPQQPATPQISPSQQVVKTPATVPSSAAPSKSLPFKTRRGTARMPAPPANVDPAAPVVVVAETSKPVQRSSADEQRALYFAAHRLHFRGAPTTALAAWDAYLATNPEGSLVAEARYNRAVTLVRLGRIAEAREALAPFARGELAGFRQADAKRFLATLPQADAANLSDR